MRPKGVARWVLTIAGLAGLAVGAALPAAASTTPARASATPGWRVVKTLGPFDGDATPVITATSASDAWYTISALGTNHKDQSYVLHWTGTAWRSVPVPAGLKSYVAGTEALGVVSAQNVWIFSGGQSPETTALRWNGRDWYKQAIPPWVIHGNLSGEVSAQAASFSATNLWVFSEGQDKFTNPDHYAARFNGHSWSKVNLPVVPGQISAVSPTDIWVLGGRLSNPSAPLLAHWNGKKWSTLALPSIKVAKGSMDQVADLAAFGAANVWAINYVTVGSAGAAPSYLLHWNGKAWSRVYLKYPTSYADSLTSDGHGGIWMEATGPGPAYQWRFYHRTAVGQWAEYVVGDSSKVSLTGSAWIPGTSSLWATAETFPSNTTASDEILKYGH
ncbi:MAG: hypothetical protein ABSA02_39575 [Trebonia sp.]|jgi:hypothetical protein